MDFDSYYAPSGDIAYVRVRPATGSVRSEEESWGLRDYDRGTGELVGIEVWKAAEVLPEDFIKAFPRLEEEDDESVELRPHRPRA